LDVARVRRVVLELFAQVGDVNVYHMVATEIVFSPHTLQESTPAEDDPRTRSQGGEQLELQGGEGHLFSQEAHLAPGEVYGQFPEA
jgi:hypothetical protein